MHVRPLLRRTWYLPKIEKRALSNGFNGTGVTQNPAFSSTNTSSSTSPSSPRHFLSSDDLSPRELATLIRNAYKIKQSMKKGRLPRQLDDSLARKTIAMVFNKRSTRTRVSTEAAVAALKGHPMFLGKEDIQLNYNECVRDTSTVISSMVSAIIARVAAHKDIVALAEYSTVPVINALSDDFHPLQTLADCLTLYEALATLDIPFLLPNNRLFEGVKIAWVGDANNVLFDLAIGITRLGGQISVATPRGYSIPWYMQKLIEAPIGSSSHSESKMIGKLQQTDSPEEAVKDADFIFTDTWISMGWESEQWTRLKAFEGFQVTEELARKGEAKENWRFLHCLPRHPEEVSDQVFYHPQRSLVFTEAENRLYAMMAVLEAFVLKDGNIRDIQEGRPEGRQTLIPT